MVVYFGPLVTSVVLVLALVKPLAGAAVNQTEAGAGTIEQAEKIPYHFQLLYWLKHVLDEMMMSSHDCMMFGGSQV